MSILSEKEFEDMVWRAAQAHLTPGPHIGDGDPRPLVQVVAGLAHEIGLGLTPIHVLRAGRRRKSKPGARKGRRPDRNFNALAQRIAVFYQAYTGKLAPKGYTRPSHPYRRFGAAIFTGLGFSTGSEVLRDTAEDRGRGWRHNMPSGNKTP